MPQRHFFRALRATLLMWVLALAALPSHAQLEIGIVDEDKLADGYTKYKEAVVSLDKQVQELDTQLDSREMLNAVEGKRFDELIVKNGRSEAENGEMQNLIKTGSGRRAEMLGLIGKANRVADDDKRLKELTDAGTVNAGAARAIQDKLYSQIKQNQEKIDEEYTKRADQVIEQVAADKKLALVWRKRAIIWHAASIDITDEVLARLNKV